MSNVVASRLPRAALVLLAIASAGACDASPSRSPDVSLTAPTVEAWGPAADRATFEDPLGWVRLEGIEPAGSGWIAVGGDALGAATWTSRDGLGWRKQPVDPDLAFGLITGARVGDQGIVAWGPVRPTPWEEKQGLWASRDGTDWRSAAGLPERASVWNTFDVGSGWLAVLVEWDGGRTLLMSSENGVDWTLAGTIESRPEQLMRAAGATDSGLWLVFWSAPGMVVWHSTDGRDWKETAVVPHEEAEENRGSTFVNSIAESRGVLVMGGQVTLPTRGDVPTTWSSADGGRTWQQAIVDQISDQHVSQVVAVPSGFLALGHETIPGGQRSIVWSSPDGRTWVRASMLDTLFVRGLRVAGERVLAWGEDDATAAIWSAPAPEPPFDNSLAPQPKCPIAEPTLIDALRVAAPDRLACFGPVVIAGRGWLPIFEGGGACEPWEPSWLACDSPTRLLAPVAGPRVRGLPVIVHPDALSELDDDTEWVAFSGSFDHPDALTCRSTVPVSNAEAAAIIERCREWFVVTEVRPVRGP